MEFDFSEIRPYRTKEEIVSAVEALTNDDVFYQFAKQMFKGNTLDVMFAQLSDIESIFDFQHKIIFKLLQKLVRETTDGITVEGLDNLDKNKNYLFISNHRDIIMDSALLCYLLMKNGLDTVEIAIGSNLFIYPWIERLVKLNKSFIVKRGVVGKEQLTNAKELSAYILDTITQRKQSIWLAQKEGRTKDGIDKTQLSVLKMLNFSNSGTVAENLKALNIVPLSISYENEPCDFLKTKELYLSQAGTYVKTKEDDLKSMFMGLKMEKGRVHFSIGKPLEIKEKESDKIATNNELLEEAVAIIDQHIISNYKLYPNNYIALDLLNKDTANVQKYTQKERESFIQRMEKMLEKIDGKTEIHEKIFLEIYANPVLEQQKL